LIKVESALLNLIINLTVMSENPLDEGAAEILTKAPDDIIATS